MDLYVIELISVIKLARRPRHLLQILERSELDTVECFLMMNSPLRSI
jgi:hypothetical protein